MRLLNARRGQGGFSLIEVLAAFLIMVFVLGAIFSSLGGATRGESRADFLLRATRYGQSKLDALGVSEPIASGDSAGFFEPSLQWRLRVAPLPAAPAGSQPGPSLYWVFLTIDGCCGEDGRLEFASVKIFRPPTSRPVQPE